MSDFLHDIFNYAVIFARFIATISNSIWTYVIVLLFLLIVFFYLIADNK